MNIILDELYFLIYIASNCIYLFTIVYPFTVLANPGPTIVPVVVYCIYLYNYPTSPYPTPYSAVVYSNKEKRQYHIYRLAPKVYTSLIFMASQIASLYYPLPNLAIRSVVSMSIGTPLGMLRSAGQFVHDIDSGPKQNIGSI